MATVNLKMLSEALQVSVSTVSKALRGSYEISEVTKKKVIEMADKMGYIPNPYAGFLRNHKSKNIALLVPELSNNFFIQAISGAESVAQEKDYHILIYNTHNDTHKEASILKHLQNGRVDAVIMSLAGNTRSYGHLEQLIQMGIPIVFFDRICYEIETAKITTDDFTSSFNATEHLIQNGCKDIAFLTISEYLSINNKRKQGYFEALNKYDIKPNNNRVVLCNGDEEGNRKLIKKMLMEEIRPDAVFASVERLGLGTYSVCNELKIKIPNQLKVIAFSNLRTAALLDPSLTTIAQPAFEMGKQAATLLFKYLGKKRSIIQNENIVLKSELIKRNSTKRFWG